MTNKIEVNKLSIFLIKEDLINHEDILKDFDKLKSKTLDIGTFYSGESHTIVPAWINNFFGQALDDIRLFNASTKAVLLVPIQINGSRKLIFAITFGFGWLLLKPGSYEERFGLKTLLNIVDPNSLRSIDKQNMSTLSKHTREQMSRDGITSDFGIDIEQDLIRSITGKSKDKKFGKTLTGKDSLSLSPQVNITNIMSFLKTCYEKFKSDEYKKDFGWIDQMEEIRDPKIIEQLNDEMFKNINGKKFDKIWMAVPEIIEWADISGFAYKNSKKELNIYSDINLGNFLDTLSEEEKENISLQTFKNKYVYCQSSSTGEAKYHWKTFSCIYCELYDDQKKKMFILSNGSWYEIEESFANQVQTDFLKLRNENPSVVLPDYNNKNENDYNEQIPKQNGNICSMDRKIINFGGGYSKIEFCDLFTNDKKIIHVKRYSGSSLLSHLFSQGVVSGELFLSESEFRSKVNNELPVSHKFTNENAKPKASDYEIVYAIISSSNNDLEIPFFSKVSLRNAKRRLETYGYKVSLQKIKNNL